MYPASDPSRLLPCSTPSFPRVALTWSPCFYCPPPVCSYISWTILFQSEPDHVPCLKSILHGLLLQLEWKLRSHHGLWSPLPFGPQLWVLASSPSLTLLWPHCSLCCLCNSLGTFPHASPSARNAFLPGIHMACFLILCYPLMRKPSSLKF